MNDGLVGVPKIEFYGNATDWKTLKSAEKCVNLREEPEKSKLGSGRTFH